MALYGSLLEALNGYYGFDTMQKVYYNGVKLGLQGNKQWTEYYELLAQNSEGLIEYTTASGKPVGLWSVQATTTTTELATTSTSTELVTIDMAMGTEVGEYAGEIIPKLSTVGAEGSTTVGSFVVGEVLPAVGAAAAGVVLGVAVDSALYNSNPDYWDEKLPTLNPQTWDDIVLGHDTKIPFLHNTQNGKTYINENMLGYTAMVGDNDGWFSSGEYDEKKDDNIIFNNYGAGLSTTVKAYSLIEDGRLAPVEMHISGGFFISLNNGSSLENNGIYVVTQDNAVITYSYDNIDYNIPVLINNPNTFTTYTYDGKKAYIYNVYGLTVYKGQSYIGSNVCRTPTSPNTQYMPICTYPLPQESSWAGKLGWVALFGSNTIHHKPSPTGINKIGVTPNISGLSNLNNVLSKLQTTYPDLYDNSIDVPYYDKNTDSVTHSTWIPAPIPTNYTDNDGSTTNKPNNKPTTNNLNQTNDGSYPDNNTENQAKENTITEGATPTPPSNIDPINPILPSEQTPNINLPVSPVDTGLGAVYVPTISQLRSFSEWLWSPNFIDQIKKLFSDPMQGIIGLHQVYFTPSHDGDDTIHCGYLDSEVSSDYTTTRYIKVDCGSVNVKETFGNVFDYDPLTTIECYLPFIGIVPLKVGDVMRSTLSIEYVCDVLTGACLCNIYVNRDGAKCVLYSYGGNCAVNYPLSSGSYMGIVSSLVGVGLSIGSAIATGGASIPLSVAGGAVSMMNAHTNVKTSGGYGGNTGAMGIKKPYLIIKNTLSAMPDNYNKYIGNPYNNTKKINECRGFTQANVLHLNGDMLQQEKEEIINLFNSGVII